MCQIDFDNSAYIFYQQVFKKKFFSIGLVPVRATFDQCLNQSRYLRKEKTGVYYKPEIFFS